MLLGVVELRAKDWGRMEPDPKLNPQQANPYLNQNAMAMSGPPMVGIIFVVKCLACLGIWFLIDSESEFLIAVHVQ